MSFVSVSDGTLIFQANQRFEIQLLGKRWYLEGTKGCQFTKNCKGLMRMVPSLEKIKGEFPQTEHLLTIRCMIDCTSQLLIDVSKSLPR